MKKVRGMHVWWNYPRASSVAIKNACLLTLQWCYEVLFPDFWWQ